MFMLKYEICIIAVMALLAVDVACAEGIARAGSPLYTIAVNASVRGLKHSGKDEPAKPDEVCKDCGKVHAPVAKPLAIPGGGAVPVAPAGEVCAQCGVVHPPAGSVLSTNAPAHVHQHEHPALGTDVGDFYYCDNCKTYHRRDKDAAAPAPPALLPNLLTNFLSRAAGGGGPRSR